MNKLILDQTLIQDSRRLATNIAQSIQRFIDRHTTVSVERAVLRLLGIDGVDSFDVPLPNRIVDDIVQHDLLSRGASLVIASALVHTGYSLEELIHNYLEKDVPICGYPLVDSSVVTKTLKPYLDKTMKKIAHNRSDRDQFLQKYPKKQTELYVIVATGNIHEDVIQAKAAARAGADIIAVIRTTGQSLLDYVPYGLTTEGFGGTYATQANFRLMRKALDQVSVELGRYIKLVNYASGLCMPEIAAMAAVERLDVLLNDSMYGIIFRDINMQRTFVDQYFSRRLNAHAGILINTGEDNYLTTADAFDEAHTVLASQFINEQFAYLAKLPASLMGLGHAYEIDPGIENSFLYEVAQAQMAREIFPDAPLKYMPPTKHSTGNIFQSFELDTLFNIAAQMTNQSIHLLGMMTEAIHTPFLSDRNLAIQNAKMVQTAMHSIYDEISFKPDGLIHNRAKFVLESAHRLLQQIERDGLFQSLEKGVFANVKRPYNGGKGLAGVVEKHPLYLNVVLDRMEHDYGKN